MNLYRPRLPVLKKLPTKRQVDDLFPPLRSHESVLDQRVLDDADQLQDGKTLQADAGCRFSGNERTAVSG